MARFYVLENKVVPDHVTGKPFLRLVLGVRLANPQDAKKAIEGAQIKNNRLRFPDLLKVFASLHGTYSQPPRKRRGYF